jgi:hypothetical protein
LIQLCLAFSANMENKQLRRCADDVLLVLSA